MQHWLWWRGWGWGVGTARHSEAAGEWLASAIHSTHVWLYVPDIDVALWEGCSDDHAVALRHVASML